MDWWEVIGGIAQQVRRNEHGGRGNDAEEQYKQMKQRTPGLIGALGSMTFEVSPAKVQTFRDYNRKTRARIASHDVIGGEKSVLEYVGGEASEISFKIQLCRDLGVEIEEELMKLDNMVNSGVAYYLVLGGEVIGYNKWYVTEIGETLEQMDNTGLKWFTTVDVTLREAVL